VLARHGETKLNCLYAARKAWMDGAGYLRVRGQDAPRAVGQRGFEWRGRVWLISEASFFADLRVI
jgi:hypothetical protein